ncbi:hypothetical protein Hanom_Chr05g00414161 [Helianthus anomalus]
MCFYMQKSTNFNAKHNICCTLDKTLPKMKPFEDVLEFISRRMLLEGYSIKDDDGKDVDVEVVIKVGDIRRVLDLKDNERDLVQVSERLCKGLWFRMGYTGTVNDSSFNKSNISMPYKFLVHLMIHSLCHIKGGYDGQ